MPGVLLLFAHPRLEKSRANRALIGFVPPDDRITFRDLYELYPDFDIDVAEEQRQLLEHDVILWHHPFYWYSAPPLVKQWIDLVLAFGWAYGPGGTALRGKALGHVLTTGGTATAYSAEGSHGFTVGEFLRPLQRTATLCGMRWLPPFVVFGTHRLTEAGLDDAGAVFRQLLVELADGSLSIDAVSTYPTMNDALAARRS